MKGRKVGKIIGTVTADGAVREIAPQSGEPQAKPGAPLKNDWIAITTEIAFREATATKKQRDKSDLSEAKSMRRWCARQLKQRPASASCARSSRSSDADFAGLNDFPAIPAFPAKTQTQKAAVSASIQWWTPPWLAPKLLAARFPTR